MTLSTLEVLHTARARIANKRMEWDFNSFSSCTCGHIYAAAAGRKEPNSNKVFRKLTGEYRDVMLSTARALGFKSDADYGNADYDAAVWFVSDLTADEPRVEGAVHVSREAALAVLDRAIAAIEAQQERDRLAVLAQTRAIVDAARVEEAA